MRFFLRTSDTQGRDRCGSDWGAVCPRTIRTEKGARKWAQAWISAPRLPRQEIGAAVLECYADGANPYGEPLRTLKVK